MLTSMFKPITFAENIIYLGIYCVSGRLSMWLDLVYTDSKNHFTERKRQTTSLNLTSKLCKCRLVLCWRRVGSLSPFSFIFRKLWIAAPKRSDEKSEVHRYNTFAWLHNIWNVVSFYDVMSCQMIKKGKIWEMMVMFDILANIRYPLLFIDVCVRRYRVHCGSATWSSGWHHRVKSKGATNDPTHHIHTYTPTADMNDSESEWIQSNSIIIS